jgi:hypothetical protein
MTVATTYTPFGRTLGEDVLPTPCRRGCAGGLIQRPAPVGVRTSYLQVQGSERRWWIDANVDVDQRTENVQHHRQNGACGRIRAISPDHLARRQCRPRRPHRERAFFKRLSELMRVSQPLTCADAPVCAIEPPKGSEVLTTAMTGRCAITIMYERGLQRPTPRQIMPRLVMEVYGASYVIVHCHQDGLTEFRSVGSTRTLRHS